MSRGAVESRHRQRASASSSYGLAEIWKDCDRIPRVGRGGRAVYHMRRAWTGIRAAPLITAATTATIAVALFLLAVFVVTVRTLEVGLRDTRGEITVTLFLRQGVAPGEMQTIAEELQRRPQVESVLHVSPDTALERFRVTFEGNEALLQGLEHDNPLPHSLEIRFVKGEMDAQRIEAIAEEFRNNALVEHVDYSHGLLRQIGKALDRLRAVGAIAGIFVLVLMGFIISNTIQLALYSRRAEIEIMHLVGATEGFVRAPFMIEGAVQGLAGGVAALAFLAIVVEAMEGFARGVSLFELIEMDVQGLGLAWSVSVLAVGIVVGISGSYVAVRRFSNR